MRRSGILAIIAGGLILTLTMGVRQTFGLFQPPLAVDLGLGREAFGFAMALQNLLWGAFQPITGAVADRFGAGRVVIGGTLAYGLGLLVMAGTESAWQFNLGGGLLVGLGLSGTGFSVVLGAVSRLVPAEKRSLALGIASAGGSFGQFAMANVGLDLIDAFGWSHAFLALAAIALLMAPLALMITGRNGPAVSGEQSFRAAMVEAGRHRGYWLLTLGFFVCGFQVVFVAVHLPAYVADLGLPPWVGAQGLALIGLFNIVGTYACGVLGNRYSKKYLLSGLYILRSLVITVFLLAPKTETNVLLFTAALGLLWLGTVPLTSGLVAQIFGVRFMSTLFGFVFFSHQLGSFLGAWLGGVVFETMGSYDPIWIASIILGLVSALLHVPIAERPLRPQTATAG